MTVKALAAAAAAAFALLATGSGAAEQAKSVPLLGLVSGPSSDSLVRVDPSSLKPAGKAKLKIGLATYSWAFSPDRSLLAVGRYEKAGTDWTDSDGFVRLVDPRAMRVVADIPVGRGSILPFSMAWLSADRIAAVARSCCSNDSDLVIVDPVARRLVERRPLPPGSTIAVRQAAGRLVVLSPGGAGLGPVQVWIVGPDGIRSIILDRIRGGIAHEGEGADFRAIVDEPGLALQPDGQRGFVFAPGGLVADVNLSSLAVAYHSLAHRTVAIRTKELEGSVRYASVLPNGSIAVTGFDMQPFVDADGHQQFRREPAGLELVDPQTWTARVVNPNLDYFTLVRNSLLATGMRWTSASATRAYGLTSYTLDGTKRFQLFKGWWTAVDRSYGTRAFVSVKRDMLHIVDTARGKVLGKRQYKNVPWFVTP